MPLSISSDYLHFADPKEVFSDLAHMALQERMANQARAIQQQQFAQTQAQQAALAMLENEGKLAQLQLNQQSLAQKAIGDAERLAMDRMQFQRDMSNDAIKARDAAMKFQSIQDFRNAVARGEDPRKAFIQFGPGFAPQDLTSAFPKEKTGPVSVRDISPGLKGIFDENGALKSIHTDPSYRRPASEAEKLRVKALEDTILRNATKFGPAGVAAAKQKNDRLKAAMEEGEITPEVQAQLDKDYAAIDENISKMFPQGGTPATQQPAPAPIPASGIVEEETVRVRTPNGKIYRGPKSQVEKITGAVIIE